MTKNFAWYELASYQYDLPKELIAQHPAERRDQSRLLRYERKSGKISHHVFENILDLLRKDDVLILNNCKVIPARLFARRTDTRTKVELLLTSEEDAGLFTALVRPGHSCKPGVKLNAGGIALEIEKILEDGRRLVRFQAPSAAVNALLEDCGEVPLPPYIERPQGPSPDDKARYQTVYAKAGRAVAAPTAGLHFTKELLKKLQEKGIALLEVTLDVGIGTFKPVKTNDIREHEMHRETFRFTEEQAAFLNEARKQGRRLIAVGTTSLRVLESSLDEAGNFTAGKNSTNIFIHPPNPVRSIDALITNFHLPGSTLLMLVAALVGEDWRRIYETAVQERYRFFSYGDSMLIE